MSVTSERSVETLKALEKVGAINLDVLISRAEEVRGALKDVGVILEPGEICYRFTMHIGPQLGDIVSVAAEVEQLGFAIERVQQR
ncbi:MAG: hypothetical protein ACRDWT_09535 [Jatrophihabitantaceae bacterium]